MQIRAGYEIAYECAKPTPMVLMLSVHPSREADLLAPQTMRFDPPIPAHTYRDAFGNTCTRVIAPAGLLTVSSDFLIKDSGLPDIVAADARQTPVEELPDDVLMYLLEQDRF